jgi:hypothetical protein
VGALSKETGAVEGTRPCPTAPPRPCTPAPRQDQRGARTRSVQQPASFCCSTRGSQDNGVPRRMGEGSKRPDGCTLANARTCPSCSTHHGALHEERLLLHLGPGLRLHHSKGMRGRGEAGWAPLRRHRRARRGRVHPQGVMRRWRPLQRTLRAALAVKATHTANASREPHTAKEHEVVSMQAEGAAHAPAWTRCVGAAGGGGERDKGGTATHQQRRLLLCERGLGRRCSL